MRTTTTRRGRTGGKEENNDDNSDEAEEGGGGGGGGGGANIAHLEVEPGYVFELRIVLEVRQRMFYGLRREIVEGRNVS